jgi:hypothetical protein
MEILRTCLRVFERPTAVYDLAHGWPGRLRRSWLVELIRSDLPGWVQAVIAVVLLAGAGAGGAAIAHSGHGRATTTILTTPPKGPVYLSDLQPQGGDTPLRGDTQIGDQDFAHSIFYDNITDNQSNASACQNVADPTCQATDYSIADTRYHRFSAMLGVTDGCSGDTGHWSLIADNVVVKSGAAAVNSSPQRIAVAIPAGNSLELLASDSGFSGAACGGTNIIWGNAQLS